MNARPIRRLAAAALVVAPLAVAGCAAFPPDEASVAESRAAMQARVVDRAAIRRVLDDLELAESSGNRAALAALYAPDAQWLPPDGAAVVGRTAVLGAYDALLEGHDLSTVLDERSLEPLGDEAQYSGWMTRTRSPHAGDDPRSETLLVRIVLGRDPERGWRIRFLEWRIWEDLAPAEADGADAG